MTTSNIYKVLEKAEDLIAHGFKVPLMPLTMINEDRLFDILDKIRTSLPREIQESQTIIKRRDDIHLEAQSLIDFQLQSYLLFQIIFFQIQFLLQMILFYEYPVCFLI